MSRERPTHDRPWNGAAVRVVLGASALTAVSLLPSAAVSPRGAVVGVPVMGASIAQCDEPSCRPESPRLDRPSYARALSLDLRGTIPSLEELASIASASGDGVPDEMLDAWLAEDAFAERTVRHHRELLWNNLANVRFVHFLQRVGQTPAAPSGSPPSTRRWYRSATAREIRPNDAQCDDREDTLLPDGRARVDAMGMDGWVMVHPYWEADPSVEIPVCAMDAQTNRMSASGRDCATREAANDPGCGCGPNLVWCDTQAVQDAIVAGFNRDVELRIAASLETDAPYTEVFTSRRGFVNGPIVHYLRHQARWYNSVPLLPMPYELEQLPDLAYTDIDTWVELELPDMHAGVLTSPAYLLRFQTNRSRASHFYDAFLCSPFTPPAGGLPVASEAEQRELDLQLRAGCRYCHAILEPAGSHWGRWGMQAGGFLDAEQYPPFLQECADCARGEETCSDTCRLNYVTRALSSQEEPYIGMMRVYEFLRPEHASYVEEGPAGLIRDGLADGRFTECTVRRTTEWLIGRPIAEGDAGEIADLETTFVSSGLRMTPLVRAIVTSDLYRRAR